MHGSWVLLLLPLGLVACSAQRPRPSSVQPRAEGPSIAADAGSSVDSGDVGDGGVSEVEKQAEPAALGYRRIAVEAGRAALPPKVRRILEAPDDAELLRIDPNEGESGFHGHKVLARRALGKDDALTVAGTVALGVALGGATARCFEPGYAVRATRAGVSVDIGLCFDCMLVRFYAAGPKGADIDLPLGKEILPDLRHLEGK